MAKIQFRIRDEGKRVISQASLVVSCLFKNGEKWKSERKRTDNSGVIWLEIPNNLLRRFDWESLALNLTKNRRKLTHTFSKPEKVNPGAYQIIVTVMGRDVGEDTQPDIVTPEPVEDPLDNDNTPRRDNDVQPGQYVVLGRIEDRDGRPQSGVSVKAFDRDIGTETLLGATRTEKNGTYRISYSVAGLSVAGKKYADLLVRAYRQRDENVILVESPLILKASPLETVNLSISRGRHRGISEFERIDQAISGKIAPEVLGRLDVADAWLLADRSNLPVKKVGMYIAARKLASDNDLPASVFFGLLASGGRVDINTVLGRSTKWKLRELQRAARRNQISGYNEKIVAGQLNAYQAGLLTRETRLNALLDLAGLKRKVRQLVIDTCAEQESGEAFWRNLEASPDVPAAALSRLRLVSRLYLVSGGHEKLVAASRERFGLESERALAGIDRQVWLEMIADPAVGLPGWAADRSSARAADAARRQYASHIADALEQTSPIHSLAARLEQSDSFGSTSAIGFLRNHPEFDIAGTAVRAYLHERSRKDSNGFKMPGDAVLAEIETIQRLYQLSPAGNRFPVMQALWESGVRSAPQIAALGKKEFAEKFSGLPGGKPEALAVHETARKITNQAIAMYGRFNPALAGPATYVLPVPSGGQMTALSSTSSAFVQAGAGGMDFCVVSHCDSILSPSAYLVDLVLYVENAVFDGSSMGLDNGKDVLLFRRPDIGRLLLNCENSDVPLPYIDLVNEVLESVVANPGGGLLIPADSEPQTTRTAEELAAHPESLSGAAYNKLATTATPWSLPFNLWEEEARAYLSHLGISRHELISLFHPLDDPLTMAAYTREFLRVSPGALPITMLRVTSKAGLAAVWRVRQADPVGDLSSVSLFLDRVGEDFDGLVALLESRYVNPGQTVVVEFPDNNCNLDSAALLNLDLPFLDRCHRFTRLRNIFGLSIHEMDRCITALSKGEINPVFLARYAAVEWIRRKWPVALDKALAWWSDMDHVDYSGSKSLYSRLFLDPTTSSAGSAGSVDLLDAFSLTAGGELKLVGQDPDLQWLARWSVDGSTIELNEKVITYVCAALGLVSGDVDTIVRSEFPAGLSEVPLTLNTLSRIYRIGSIARTLGLDVDGYYRVLGITGESPVPGDDASTIEINDLRFFNGYEAIQASGFEIEELDYLLRHQETVPASVGFDIAVAEQSLLEVRKAVSSYRWQPQQDFLARMADLELRLGIYPALDAVRIATLPRIINGNSGMSPEEITDFVEQEFQEVLSGGVAVSLVDNVTNPTAEHRLNVITTDLDGDNAAIARLHNQIAAQSGWDSTLAKQLLAIVLMASDLTDIEQADFILEHVDFMGPADLVENLVGSSQLTAVADRVDHVSHNMMLSLVYQTVATAVVLDRRLVEAAIIQQEPVIREAFSELFTTQFLDPEGEITEDLYPELFDLYRRLDKISRFQVITATSAQSMLAIVELALEQNWLDLCALPVVAVDGGDFHGWRRLIDAIALHDRSFSEELSLFGFLSDLSDVTQVSELVDLTHFYTGWSRTDLEYLASLTGTSSVVLQVDQDAITKTERAIGLTAQAGVPARTLQSWSANLTTAATAQVIKNAVKARYDLDDWYGIARDIRDGLRIRQRDALLAYIIGHNSYFRNATDVYKSYLIDPEMQPCMLTTRTKLANASVQLLVQRIMLGLEVDPRSGKSLAFDREDATEWKWRKNYRVWEANRKVFIYPENWIEPELRDNKTQLFEAYENELSQGDVTQRSVEEALVRYVESLDQVACLEICSFCRDERDASLHICGRTFASPHTYYYRQKLAPEGWTPWEKIEQQIDGDHLLITHKAGRVMLIWPTFKGIQTRVADSENFQADVSALENEITSLQNQINAIPGQIEDVRLEMSDYIQNARPMYAQSVVDDYNEEIEDLEELKVQLEGELETKQGELAALQQSGTQTDVFHEITLNWLEKKGDAWSQKLTSTESLLARLPLSSALEMRVVKNLSDDELVIRLDENYTDSFGKGELGSFSLNVCTGLLEPRAAYGSVMHDLFQVEEATFRYQTWVELPGSHLLWITKLDDRGSATPGYGHTDKILDNTPGVFNLSKLQEEQDLEGPFFFEINNRVFLVDQASGGIRLNAESLALTVSKGSGKPVLAKRKDGVSLALEKVPYSGFFGAENARDVIVGGATTADLAENFGGFSADVLDQLMGSNPTFSFPSNPIPAPIDPAVALRDEDTRYRFHNFYHPYTCLFLRQLRRYGVDGLLAPNPDLSDDHRALFRQRVPGSTFNFQIHYQATELVDTRYPIEDISFDYTNAYAQYNWELFFHVPFLTACRFMQDQKFDDAQRWFHYIFDPTETVGYAPTRFWKLKPFVDYLFAGGGEDQGDIIFGVTAPGSELSLQVAEWEDNPFQPHVIARMRISAYMKAVVMKYLDNLVAWGDHLFRRDTMESLNEATQLYLLAGQILGRPPQSVKRHSDIELSVNELVVEGVDALGNAIIDLTNYADSTTNGVVTTNNAFNTLLYFGFPENDTLLSYWETVSDRLFKIRHCMNIEGIERDLPIYEPPIDPALLVRAVAQGVDIASAVDGLYAPLPCYRFTTSHARAIEFGQAVQFLGQQLLSALERRDGEEMSLLNASLSMELLDQTTAIRQDQVAESRYNLDSLRDNLQRIADKTSYYDELIEAGLNDGEVTQAKALDNARISQIVSNLLQSTASFMHLFPDLTLPVGGATTGGSHFGHSAGAAASAAAAATAEYNFQASKAGTLAMQQRRAAEWAHSLRQSEIEKNQVEKQVLAAEIRMAITDRDLSNHLTQLEHQQQTLDLLRDKHTSEELYDWMFRQVSDIYFQSYQLAYDMARRAEKCFQYELDSNESFLQYGYWDSAREGLLSGDRLLHDMRRMDARYMALNKRRFELSKTFSVALLDPAALLAVRNNGECFIELPETLFDLDYPGHYLRKIKSVSLTIPCISGPYTSISCTLTQLTNRVRKSNSSASDYPMVEATGSDFDERFAFEVGAVQSIATSSANADSGLFELNFRDERYLPFEGSGAISSWKVRLAAPALAQFDYATISDVLLHVSYTAVDGGDLFRQHVENYLLSTVDAAIEGNAIFRQGISLRGLFPQEWARIVNVTESPPTFGIELREDHFPFLMRNRELVIQEITVSLSSRATSAVGLSGYVELVPGSLQAPLSSELTDPLSSGVLTANFKNLEAGLPASWSVSLPDPVRQQLENDVDDVYLVIKYIARPLTQ